jgi:hypothetical protein
MNYSVDSQELAGLIRRTNELLTVLAKKAMADVLETELAKPKYDELYRLTGGDLPVKAISQKVGIAVGTISVTWQKWEELGLLVKDGHRYRRVLG